MESKGDWIKLESYNLWTLQLKKFQLIEHNVYNQNMKKKKHSAETYQVKFQAVPMATKSFFAITCLIETF